MSRRWRIGLLGAVGLVLVWLALVLGWIWHGLREKAILTEEASRTKMENLVFAQPGNMGRGGGTVLLVTDPLHMRRALTMAR
ncbi:YdcF family protein [Aurantiacibacter suaedae]|uniref:YdcF family protein n=1 Tax=Aurantiacibacter suaedae TaxID=2545755 RepID=UPI0010F44F6F|nr:YdcF family protein [Aurantiacibacter suaedae]